MDLSSIENKIKELVGRCQVLQAENADLKQRCEAMTAKNQQAVDRVQALLTKLKPLLKDDV